MRTFIKLFTILIIVGSISGCKKFLDKLNNPNLVTNPPLDGLMATVTFKTGTDVFNLGNEVSYYTQYLASNVSGSDADIYNEVDYSDAWSDFYSAMANIRRLTDKATTENSPHHRGIGKVLLALNLNLLVNAFGDIPYSSALQGLDKLVPVFDDQASVYNATLSLLDESITDLTADGNGFVIDSRSDVIHHGDIDAWVKTAYTLKARFLNQRSKSADYAPAEILAALAKGYTGNEDDAAMTAFSGFSPWNNVAENNAALNLDGWLSTQFVDALNGNTFGVMDPRLPKIASITQFDDYRGTPNGEGRIGSGTDNEESYLSLDGFYSAPGAPLLIVTNAEARFIEAEAAFRSGDADKAYTAYIDGISAHMDKLGVAAADKDAYLANPSVGVGKNNITLDLIFKEKYVVMFLNPEAWVDARRYDYKYKDFTLPTGAVLTDFIRRLAYPSIETSRNGGNVPAVTSLTEKLRFDQ
jgi:Starch-binding associating with outer membrane